MTERMLTNATIQSGRNGGDIMPRKPRSLTLGEGVTLRELGPDKYELRTRKPKDSKQVLFCSWSEAQQEAIRAHERVKLQLDGQRLTNPTISAALTQAVAAGRGNAETIGRYTRDANRFMEWIAVAYPGLHFWRDVRPSVIKHYQQHLESRDLARDSIRQALLPIQKASKHWAIEYPRLFDEIARGIRLPAAPPPKVVTLSYEQLCSVLTWLRENYPAVYPIAAMAGFLGMRLREAAGILNENVDLVAGTVTLESNHLRQLKNETYSPRTIPLTEKAVEAIAAYRDAAKVKTMQPGEAFFLDSKGEAWTAATLGQECRNASKRIKPALKLPAAFCIRRLRSTFNTLAFVAGAREAYLQRYVGQTPTTIGRRHYLEVRPEDLKREVSAFFDQLGKPVGKVETENEQNQSSASG